MSCAGCWAQPQGCAHAPVHEALGSLRVPGGPGVLTELARQALLAGLGQHVAAVRG
jgi:hypothetical protein